jgi:crotonobetainyl-CoA:carnitine CoA-transferase CaiB-like acyl-CoA transferase
MKNSPLKNIRIIDLSRLYPGPLCTLVLSDMGSEVIKIESPDNNGDLMRNTPANFEALNRGKKSISLNLSKKEGKCSLFKLIEISDVIVESFRPGVFEKLLNVTVSDLRKMFPHCMSIAC